MTIGGATVFLFPGQGAQHPRMAADLYGTEQVFTDTMDEAFTILDDPALRKIWLQPDPGPMFHDITRAQPLLLSVNYALARTLIASGAPPDALLGHSVGEIAAAAVAGVFEFRDALTLLAEFVRTYRHAPPGGMLAVAASADAVRERMNGLDDVVLGAVNGPKQVLVCGGRSGLEAIRQRLIADGVTCAPVNARQPFHSPLMNELPAGPDNAPIRPQFTARLQPPRIRMYSGYLGGLLDGAHATDPAFWLRQPASPVLFASALRMVLDAGPVTLVEVGPGQSLSMLARRTSAVARGHSRCLAVLPPRRRAPGADTAALQAVLGELVSSSPVASSPRTY
ncbi:acyltransferase domain-containing protein [Nocardia higoensis]|uniref:Acyltransferase domain-containing protein n=1 Tax=Nocardia higoensis TaxID=228599 RepID=A0ABS0D7N8_9NOCA|nr:acyltransferase domain-containing protein [Nocardia higoensis]MBF6354481.1 acyltransferase domain-containing protein [Nocardia higoensis]